MGKKRRRLVRKAKFGRKFAAWLSRIAGKKPEVAEPVAEPVAEVPSPRPVNALKKKAKKNKKDVEKE